MEGATTMPGSAQRMLAAIVFTDAVGFSARVGSDEDGTVALLRQDLSLMTSLCTQYDGQVIKSRGDGLMMLFASAVQAVNCAVEIQKALLERTKDDPGRDVLMHRVGIHLGDVLISDGDALGDGVNVAARLVEEATSGGICLSQTVYDVVKGRLFLQAVKIGDLRLKNITEPIPAYRVGGTAKTARKQHQRRNVMWAPLAVLGLALIVFGAGGMAFYMSRQHEEPSIHVLKPGIPHFTQEEDPGAAIARGVNSLLSRSLQDPALRKDSNFVERKQFFQPQREVTKDQNNANERGKNIYLPSIPPLPKQIFKSEGGIDVPVPPRPATKSDALPEALKLNPGAPPAQPSPAFNRAWKKYVGSNNFDGMAEWLDHHMDTVPIQEYGTDLVKYHQLSAFMETIKNSASESSADNPIRLNDQTKVWQRADGKFVFVTKQGTAVRDLQSLKPSTLFELVNGMIKSVPSANAQKGAWRLQMKTLKDEYRKHNQPDSRGDSVRENQG